VEKIAYETAVSLRRKIWLYEMGTRISDLVPDEEYRRVAAEKEEQNYKEWVRKLKQYNQQDDRA
jgi:hypothetical protein